MKALSIVAPNGIKIAQGIKTIEVRTWLPELPLGTEILLIENDRFLNGTGETDPLGRVVASFKIKKIRPFEPSDIEAACASSWSPGYYAWEIIDVVPRSYPHEVLAARGIYDLDLCF